MIGTADDSKEDALQKNEEGGSVERMRVIFSLGKDFASRSTKSRRPSGFDFPRMIRYFCDPPGMVALLISLLPPNPTQYYSKQQLTIINNHVAPQLPHHLNQQLRLSPRKLLPQTSKCRSMSLRSLRRNVQTRSPLPHGRHT